MGYIARVHKRTIPSVTLPVSDYDRMQHMSNSSLVCVLRENVLSLRRIRSISPHPPEDHDSYFVSRSPERIEVQLRNGGETVYVCSFVPPAEY
ncbi:MAG: hypothetical protein LIO63_04415 [Akkermansia sp.]|nr:hypothetical protein [Akkermansia sp.]MCD8071106.1 hypothetical protein [Akkermansiaceae bacterium]